MFPVPGDSVITGFIVLSSVNFGKTEPAYKKFHLIHKTFMVLTERVPYNYNCSIENLSSKEFCFAY